MKGPEQKRDITQRRRIIEPSLIERDPLTAREELLSHFGVAALQLKLSLEERGEMEALLIKDIPGSLRVRIRGKLSNKNSLDPITDAVGVINTPVAEYERMRSALAVSAGEDGAVVADQFSRYVNSLGKMFLFAYCPQEELLDACIQSQVIQEEDLAANRRGFSSDAHLPEVPKPLGERVPLFDESLLSDSSQQPAAKKLLADHWKEQALLLQVELRKKRVDSNILEKVKRHAFETVATDRDIQGEDFGIATDRVYDDGIIQNYIEQAGNAASDAERGTITGMFLAFLAAHQYALVYSLCDVSHIKQVCEAQGGVPLIANA